MAFGREKWTRVDTRVKLETPRKTFRFNELFVSPGGLLVPEESAVDIRTKVVVSFSIEKQPVVAHAEVRRILTPNAVQERGIDHSGAGWEMRLIRMEGDGSQILAEHIKRILLESGGPR